MSLLSYNGITLPYPTTTQFSQDAVYDESGTDRYLSKFDITVQTLINADYMEMLAPSLAGPTGPITNNPADIMQAIYTRLMTARRALSFQFNSVDLIPTIPANTGTVDAANGPKPQSCRFTQLTDTTFVITYHIIANYWVNNTTGTTIPLSVNRMGNSVLTNRWTESADIDSLNYTTRTREGKYIIRSDKKAAGIVDLFRNQMAVLGVNQGFLREGASYTVSPDGLALQYKIIDKEVFKPPPAPAFKADGVYMENTVFRGSTDIYSGEARVTLWGDKNTSQATLLSVAVGICAGKCLARGQELTAEINPVAIVNFANVSVDMYNNKVNAALQVQFKKRNKARFDQICTNMIVTGASANAGNAMNSLLGATAQYVRTPGSPVNGDYRPAYLNRGTAGIVLQAARYYDPSIPTQLIELAAADAATATPQSNSNSTSQFNRGLDVGSAGRIRET